jgi:hypothetical protein
VEYYIHSCIRTGKKGKVAAGATSWESVRRARRGKQAYLVSLGPKVLLNPTRHVICILAMEKVYYEIAD